MNEQELNQENTNVPNYLLNKYLICKKLTGETIIIRKDSIVAVQSDTLYNGTAIYADSCCFIVTETFNEVINLL